LYETTKLPIICATRQMSKQTACSTLPSYSKVLCGLDQVLNFWTLTESVQPSREYTNTSSWKLSTDLLMLAEVSECIQTEYQPHYLTHPSQNQPSIRYWHRPFVLNSLVICSICNVCLTFSFWLYTLSWVAFYHLPDDIGPGLVHLLGMSCIEIVRTSDFCLHGWLLWN
jgi:hypothetical protein